MINDKPHGAPEFERITPALIGKALKLAMGDMKASLGYGVIFALPYVLGGIGFLWLTWVTGQSYWLIFAAVGFPLLGPFAAVGLYEVSRRREAGLAMDWRAILGVVSSQRSGQLPWLSAVIIMVVMFWFFLGHMIFALFLGLSTMTNVSSSFEVFLTPNGLTMLAVGSAVGGVFAFIVFAISVMGIPMLLDREVDFVTAMINSFSMVVSNPVTMLLWAAVIVFLNVLAMLPMFLGMFFVLPLLGHASWHMYKEATVLPDLRK